MEFDFCTQFLHAFKWLENGRFLDTPYHMLLAKISVRHRAKFSYCAVDTQQIIG